MAQYDLTATISQYLDPHLIRPLILFLGSENVQLYDKKELLQAEYNVLQKTKMKEYEKTLYKRIHNTEQVPEEVEKEKEQVLKEVHALYEKCAPLITIINNEELLKKLEDEKHFTMTYLSSEKGITTEMLDSLYQYAKIRYECGEYEESADLLYYYRLLLPTNEVKKSYRAQWGKLAAKIMIPDYNGALDDVEILKDMIDSSFNDLFSHPLEQIQHRTWLIHWSLFVFFNNQNGKNAIIDTFLQEKYLNIIQTRCPYILRYLTTAIIVNKKKRNQYKEEISRLIEQEETSYSDPIVKFVQELQSNFNFNRAISELQNCDDILKNDYFLVGCRQDFMDNARQLVFELYCKVHGVIDIESLAQKLNMDKQNAEKWIVNVIRNARYTAKIDSKTNRVIMQEQVPNIYQQIVEKTEGLAYRTSMQKINLDKRITGKDKKK